MADRPKRTDSAASIDENGKISNARLHEEMTEGVDDLEFRLETKRKMIEMGIPKEVMDMLIHDPADDPPSAAGIPKEVMDRLFQDRNEK